MNPSDPQQKAPAWPTWWPELESELLACGFDLLFPFASEQLVELVPQVIELPDWLSDRRRTSGRQARALDSSGRPPRSALCLFVANSSRLWAAFTTRGNLGVSDPLDHYTEQCLAAARAALPVRSWVGYSHQTRPAPLPMQRLAHAIGFAELGPAQLCIHPDVGPWCALRAVLAFDYPALTLPSTPRARLCAGCTAPCVAALARALAPDSLSRSDATRYDPSTEPLRKDVRRASEVSAAMAPWLLVRDACPHGRAHRYGAEQLRYHYDKAPEALSAPSRGDAAGPSRDSGALLQDFERGFEAD